MKTNTARKIRAESRTYEGALAAHISPLQQLKRSVSSCLLWEREFYEDGQEIADRLRTLVKQVPSVAVADLAVEARTNLNLRHVPLYLTALLASEARGTSLVSETILDVVQRADELAEFIAIYAKVNGVAASAVKPKLSNQVRKGLAAAFHKFNAYGLAKYDRKDAEVRLRDALFLCHAKPRTDEQKATWAALIAGTLASPDTWEVELSAGKDKKETWTRLLAEGKLGYLALLRNLRNMSQAGVEEALVEEAILARKGAGRVLPFRYVAAARAAPQFEPALDRALLQAIDELPMLEGRTVVLVDHSNSMRDRLSAKSDLTRFDAAATLASMLNCEHLRTFSFTESVEEVPARRGMAGVDVLLHRKWGGTYLFDAVDYVQRVAEHDRMIIITDEQATGTTRFGHYIQGRLKTMPTPACEHAYVINVASAKNGVGYGPWTHLDGFSESVLRWIVENEAL